VHGLLKEPIIGPLKSNMAEIRHLGYLRQNSKTRFAQKLSNFEQWSLLTTLESCAWAF